MTGVVTDGRTCSFLTLDALFCLVVRLFNLPNWVKFELTLPAVQLTSFDIMDPPQPNSTQAGSTDVFSLTDQDLANKLQFVEEVRLLRRFFASR